MTIQSTIKITAVAAIAALLLSGSQAHAVPSADAGGSGGSTASTTSDVGSSTTPTGNGGGYDGPGDTTPGSGDTSGDDNPPTARPFDPGSAGYYRKAPHLIEGGNEALSNSGR